VGAEGANAVDAEAVATAGAEAGVLADADPEGSGADP
jgi:hypothetical protein